jgi:transcriptional regulator with XRE-family HTH domain
VKRPLSVTPQSEEGFDLVNVLGRRLRERRRELGLTLAEVAAAADISVGHSSAIEKGTTLPSLSVLARLAHALDLTLAEVLRESPSRRIAYGRIGEQASSEMLLSSGPRIRVSYRRHEAGAASPPLSRSGDDVFIFVYEGSIAVEVDRDRHELVEGDSIHCHAPAGIAWTAGARGAVTLWVMKARRERLPDPDT